MICSHVHDAAGVDVFLVSLVTYNDRSLNVSLNVLCCGFDRAVDHVRGDLSCAMTTKTA